MVTYLPEEIPLDLTEWDRYLYTYCRQNVNRCELVTEEVTVTYFEYQNIVNLCLSNLCIPEFQCFNEARKGDTVLSLASWDYIALFQQAVWGWHSGAETCKILISFMNCIVWFVFYWLHFLYLHDLYFIGLYIELPIKSHLITSVQVLC